MLEQGQVLLSELPEGCEEELQSVLLLLMGLQLLFFIAWPHSHFTGPLLHIS